MKPLCVIPARRGSKRLPEKNVAQLGGRPLLAWTIDAALESLLFDRVLVSTEDSAFAELTRELGATPHARPLELAGDLVSATDVCLDKLIAATTPSSASSPRRPYAPPRTYAVRGSASS